MFLIPPNAKNFFTDVFVGKTAPFLHVAIFALEASKLDKSTGPPVQRWSGHICAQFDSTTIARW